MVGSRPFHLTKEDKEAIIYFLIGIVQIKQTTLLELDDELIEEPTNAIEEVQSFLLSAYRMLYK